MKPGRVIVYLLVFLAAGAVYYFFEYGREEKSLTLEEARTRLFALKFDQVKSIRLTRKDQVMELVREGDGWRLTGPIQTAADKWAVDMMVRQVLDGRKERVFSDPIEDQGPFGLDKPQLSMSLKVDGHDPAPELHIGQTNPAGDMYYARLGDSREVFTVRAGLRHDMDKTLLDLRDKALVLSPATRIDGLLLKGREEIELVKKGIRRWDMLKPEEGPADDDQVQKMIHEALKGRAEEFAPLESDGNDYGFDQPELTVEVRSGETTVAEVVVGRPRLKKADDGSGDPPRIEGYWVKSSDRPEEAMFAAADRIAPLRVTVEGLRDRHVLLGLDGRALHTILIELGSKRFHAKVFQEVWEVVEPDGAKTRDRNVEAFIRSLENLRYVRELDSSSETIKKYGLAEPELKMVLTGPDDHATRLIASWRQNDENTAVVRVGNGPVVLIKKTDMTAALPEEIRPADEDSGSGRQD